MNSEIKERLESNSGDECDLSRPTIQPIQQHRISATRKALLGRLAGLSLGLAAASNIVACEWTRHPKICDEWKSPNVLYHDVDTALVAVEELGADVIKKIDPLLLRDEAFVLELLKRTSPDVIFNECNYEADILKRKPRFMLEAMRIHEKSFEYADESLKSNRTWLLKAMDISVDTVARGVLGRTYERNDSRYAKDNEVIRKILTHDVEWLLQIEYGHLCTYDPKFVREIIEMKPDYVIPILTRAGVNLVPHIEYMSDLISTAAHRDLYYALTADMRIHPHILKVLFHNNQFSEDDALELSQNLKKLNITRPERFNLKTLHILINNRLHPEKSTKKLTATVTFPEADQNRSFENNQIAEFVKHGYHVMYYEASMENDVYASLRDSTQHLPTKQTDLWILAGHGSKRRLALGAPDPRFSEVDEEKYYIDTTDFELRKYAKYLKPGAQIVLRSCAVGEGASDLYNLANSLHSHFPETLLHASTKNTKGPRYIFDSQSNQLKRVLYNNHEETVYRIYPESDKSELAEKARKGGRKWLKDRWKDTQFVLEEIKYGTISPQDFDKSLSINNKWVVMALEFAAENGWDYLVGTYQAFDHNNTISRDAKLMLGLINKNPLHIKFADRSLLSNSSFVLALVKLPGAQITGYSNYHIKLDDYNYSGTIAYELLNDPDFILSLVEINANYKRLIPRKLRNDPDFMKKVDQISPPSN